MKADHQRRVAPMAAVALLAGLALSARTSQAAPLAPAAALAAPSDFLEPDQVRAMALEFAEADWESRLAQLPEGQELLADLSYGGETYLGVGISIKGNSSARAPGRKKPLNLRLDASVDGQKLGGYDVINLNNGFADPSFTRETLVSGAIRPFLPMPRAGYVQLRVNGAAWGFFTSVQQIEGGFLKQWFPSKDGYLFKGDAPGAVGQGPIKSSGQPSEPMQMRPPGGGGGFRSSLRWLGSDLSAYRQAYELKTEAGGDAAYTRLRDLIQVLDAPVSEGGVSGADFPAAVERVLDVDGALWYLAAINLFTNYDSYYAGHNFFLYWAPEDERFHILPWDVNESFGVFPGVGISPADSQAVAHTDPFLMADSTDRPLIRRLLGVPAYRADYLAHLRALLDGAFQPETLRERVAALQALAEPALTGDPNRIYGMDLFRTNAESDVTALGRAIPGIGKVAQLRAGWLDELAELRPLDHGLVAVERDEAPVADKGIRIALGFQGGDLPAAVDLIYQVNDGPPRTLGLAAADALNWAGELPAQAAGARLRAYARARFLDGRVSFHPPANLTSAWAFKVGRPALPSQSGDLVLNELLADNQSETDPAGQHDDWVEIHNRGAAPVSLAGHFLSDEPDNPQKFPLADITLQPGGFYRVWCDEDQDQGPDHSNFKLSKSGEDLALTTASAVVDQVVFGLQATDVSWARVPDGSGAWRACAPPSPLAPNRCGGADPPTLTPTSTSSATATPPPASPSATPTRFPLPPGSPTVYLPFASR